MQFHVFWHVCVTLSQSPPSHRAWTGSWACSSSSPVLLVSVRLSSLPPHPWYWCQLFCVSLFRLLDRSHRPCCVFSTSFLLLLSSIPVTHKSALLFSSIFTLKTNYFSSSLGCFSLQFAPVCVRNVTSAFMVLYLLCCSLFLECWSSLFFLCWPALLLCYKDGLLFTHSSPFALNLAAIVWLCMVVVLVLRIGDTLFVCLTLLWKNSSSLFNFIDCFMLMVGNCI